MINTMKLNPLRKLIIALVMNPPELQAVMDSIDELPEPVKALYTEKNGKFELTGIKGVKTQADVDRLQTGITKEREETKKYKEKLAKFGDLNPDEVHAKLDRVAELETLAEGKLDDKKINDIVETRIKGRLAPLEREKANLLATKETLEKELEVYVGNDKKRRIHDIVRSAATGLKIQESAVDDVLLHADRLFELTDDGKVIAKDNVGITPGIDPTGWLQEIQGKKPHWWPASQGAGGKGSGAQGYGANPWTHEGWSMTDQGKIYKQNPAKAEQMAKAAGTTIGGPKPPKKA